MTWSLPPGQGPGMVVITDCPVCFSAGSARRGVCDICGAKVGPSGDEREDASALLTLSRPWRPERPYRP